MSVALKLILFAILAMMFAVTQATANAKYAGIVIDARTGKTLYEDRADEQRFPASLTKMMTLYLAFEAIDAGRITKDSRVPVSRKAAAERPSKIGIRAGTTISVEQAMRALVTKSANDAATALGEFLGGSEARFADLMTRKARQLGMSKTTFRNAHGLPNSQQVTTARDMARLGIALREHFPHHYHYFSTRSFTFGSTTHGNHNRLLGTVRGVDGIKTGFISASGFNLVTSVNDNGRQLVAVVMGGRTGASRNAHMQKLVGQYLPQASRSGGGNLIARAGPSPQLAANGGIVLPERGPVPVLRHPVDMRVATAYAAPATAAVAYAQQAEGQIVGREALAEVLRAQRPSAPVPPAPVGQEPAAVEMGSIDVDDMTTAGTNNAATHVPSGWVVQVAAMPDRSEAMAFLAEAQRKAGGPIAGAQPYTVAFNDGAQQLYRARFGGFSGKSAAWAACDTLKKSGYGCWATEQ